MKTAVIYNSQTGFTKKYAEWISEAAGADCFELNAAKKWSYEEYDAIIFGGWACAGKIRKISWFKANMEKWQEKRLLVFCTGGSPAESPEIEAFLRGNFSQSEWERLQVFYCPGGFNYERMSAGSKLMMRMYQKMMDSKKDKSASDVEMLKMISKSYDISDRKYIDPIIRQLKQTTD